MNKVTLGQKAVGETNPYVINFSDRLQNGESINGASVSVTVSSGIDAAPNSILSGIATYDSSGDVTQNITGGIVGVIYNLAYIVTGTASHNYVKVAQLAVVANDNAL